MSDIRDDFRSTIENAAQDARELEAIERQKAELEPADPRARSLSAKAEDLAEELHRKTLVERDLADTAAEEARAHQNRVMGQFHDPRRAG